MSCGVRLVSRDRSWGGYDDRFGTRVRDLAEARSAGWFVRSLHDPAIPEGTVHSSERIASRTSRFRDVPMMLDDQLSCVNGTRVQIEGDADRTIELALNVFDLQARRCAHGGK